MKTISFSPSLDRFPSDLDERYHQPQAYECACGAQTWMSERRQCDWCARDFCEDCLTKRLEERLCRGCLESVK
jgi:hypothetical protein